MIVGFLHYDLPEDELTMHLRDRIQVLSNGCVRDFLTASPDLEFIELLFEGLGDRDPSYNGFSLENIFGTHTWGHLERSALRGVGTRKPHLLDFFQRHAETLKHLTMENFCLTDSTCSWVLIFEQIPDILDLNSADLRGSFEIFGSDQWIHMNFEVLDGSLLGEMVSHWLLVYGPHRCRANRIPRLQWRQTIIRLLSEAH